MKVSHPEGEFQLSGIPWTTGHCRLQRRSDLFVGLAHRIVGQVGVALGRQDLRVTKQLADHRKVLAGVDAEAGVCMSQIVNPDIFDLGCFSDSVPKTLESGEVRTRIRSRNDVRIIIHLFDLRKDFEGTFVEPHCLLSRLAVFKVQATALEIYLRPFQSQDLRRATAGEDQKANRRDRLRRYLPRFLCFHQNIAETAQLRFRNIAFPRLLCVF